MTFKHYMIPSQKFATVGGPTKLAQDVKMTPELEATFREVAERLKTNPPPVREYKERGHRGSYQKRNLKTGMMFGHLVLRRKASANKGHKPSLREQWHCECIAPSDHKPGGRCGTTLIVPKYYLIRKPNPKTHCGCLFETLKSRHQREYRIWHMMHQRCLNPRHESYEHYKSRGIGIHESFLKTTEDGFANWLADVGPCPGGGYSLDRINNSKGYLPGNLKWSTATEQRLNQGDLIGGKTGAEIEELGMTEDEWVAYAKINGYL